MAPARHQRTVAIVVSLLIAVSLAIAAGTVFVKTRQQTQQHLDQNGLPASPVSYSEVNGRPEAHLYYPGSRILLRRGAPEQALLGEKPSSAYAEAILAVAAPSNTLRAWYRQTLLAHGWSCFQPLARPTTISELDLYQRGTREGFFVGIDNRRALQKTYNLSLPPAGTIYQIDYTIAPESVSHVQLTPC